VCGDPDAEIAFKKSAVCCLSFEAGVQTGTGRLDWLAPPKLLTGAV
jgi:hypothetical protein